MKRPRGLTLLEVVAALALLVLLSGSVFSFFFNVTRRREQLASMATQQHDVALLMDRLESALFSAVAIAPDGSAGVKGSGDELSVATRRVESTLEGEAALADITTLKFAFDENARAIRLHTGAGGSATLLGRVDRVRFRYSDGRTWREAFDALSQAGLPVAVEVSIWLAPREARGDVEDRLRSPADDGTLDPLSDGVDRGGAEFDFSADSEEGAPDWTPREPDHVRVIVVPDAPVAGWKAVGQ